MSIGSTSKIVRGRPVSVISRSPKTSFWYDRRRLLICGKLLIEDFPMIWDRLYLVKWFPVVHWCTDLGKQ